MADSDDIDYYAYQPSHVAPAIFAALVGVSFLLHIYQIFRYKLWHTSLWLCWGDAVFASGWVMRVLSSYSPTNLNLYIAQTCLVLGGPPIYAAAEYIILGRLMNYVPMHAPLNPNRLVIFFIYLGALVESLTAAGAAQMSSAGADDVSAYKTGGTLISISLVLQAVVEIFYMSCVVLMHRRCSRANMLAPNLRKLFWMLYGTSSLVLLRCIFRAIEAFATYTAGSAVQCTGACQYFRTHEWYLYVFEAAPMVIYTYWLNIMHPGKYLPKSKFRYLDLDGRTERIGPGWIDKRSRWQTFADPWDLANTLKGEPQHEKFWLNADQWSVAQDGSFATGTATNTGKKFKLNTRGSEMQARNGGKSTRYSPLHGTDV